MSYFIGVDPSTTRTIIAIVQNSEVPVLAALIKLTQTGHKERKASLAIVIRCEELARNRERCLPPAEWIDGIAVEGQDIYKSGPHKTKNPRSILWLAPVSGALLALLKFMYPDAPQFFPAPVAWKGSVPKQIHQTRIGEKFGWEMSTSGGKATGYAYPTDTPAGPMYLDHEGQTEFTQTDWKEAMDAIGLALFAASETNKLTARICRMGE